MTVKRILWTLVALLVLSCDELSSPPPAPDTGHLFQDSLGIWRSTDADSLPFLDMPLSYREFWRYCANCHSGSGQSPLAVKARRALQINTWEQILSYGPEKLVLAAKSGGMPLPPSPSGPDEVLSRVQAYLAAWPAPDTAQPLRLRGYRYAAAENFVRTYCADCHTPGGKNADKPVAALHLMLDDYEEWRKHEHYIQERLDTNNLLPMPPQEYTDALDPAVRAALPAARTRMIAWIDSLSPNTADGSGKGEPPVHIAVKDVQYEPAYRLINHYCADCHTEGGLNVRQLDGWTALPLDAYTGWKNAASLLLKRLDSADAVHFNLEIMPPANFRYQPTRAERDSLLEWLRLGSPNTANER